MGLKKWEVTLSTTESNYIGLVKVRQGNKNTEVLRATIIENGLPYDLSECRAAIQTLIDSNYPVERPCNIVDAKKGIVEYVFDKYTMQSGGRRQTANIAFFKGEELVGTTQDFSYFVVRAVSKTEGEMGSYWQTIEDLIEDMKEYINAGKGDFEAWFDSVKDILASVDPGGKLLKEVLDARIDLQGKTHTSISERLKADFVFIQQQLEKQLNELKESHYTLPFAEVSIFTILQDDQFSKNHEVEMVTTIGDRNDRGALVIASIGESPKDYFHFESVGEING